jgi:hypothetical protein
MKSIPSAGEFSSLELNQLQSQLNDWRHQQRKRAPLPEAVWRSAAALARSLGISHVSRALRLNYHKLNRWTAEDTDRPQDLPTQATFVELAVGDAKLGEVSHGYRVEIVDATRDKLMVHLGSDVSAVVALAESFWRRKR